MLHPHGREHGIYHEPEPNPIGFLSIIILFHSDSDRIRRHVPFVQVWTSFLTGSLECNLKENTPESNWYLFFSHIVTHLTFTATLYYCCTFVCYKYLNIQFFKLRKNILTKSTFHIQVYKSMIFNTIFLFHSNQHIFFISLIVRHGLNKNVFILYSLDCENI